MSAKMEYSGSDVADAIKTACRKLNVAQDQLEIEIVSTGSAGIFGLGRRKAKILVALKDANDGEAPAPQPTRPAREPKPARREKPAPSSDEAPPRREPAKPLSAEAVTAIQSDLLRLLELMGLPATIEAEQQDGKLRIHINGGDHIEQIIGPGGQTLDSIQYLLRKMAGKKMTERVQITLDAGDFRE
ncbi:MAG: Jag N-terminal domain-containing protein, partial [Desulfobulbaceae bacterium]|nr:Jag N-terminal domain-containing protein [Desulfobulbaceae bacterium]